MVTRRLIAIVVSSLAVVAALAYLYDPPWLIDQASGLRDWEHPAGEPRYRWSNGHASFFVPAGAGAFDIPVSTTFAAGDDRPMLVTVTVDDVVAARAVLMDESWTRVRVVLPAPGRRRVRRIDVRTNITREDFRGVRIGELEFAARFSSAGPPPRVFRARWGGGASPVTVFWRRARRGLFATEPAIRA
jgi:hypothetical protein